MVDAAVVSYVNTSTVSYGTTVLAVVRWADSLWPVVLSVVLDARCTIV